jgi:Ca2+-binding EF-hand superfamily protein
MGTAAEPEPEQEPLETDSDNVVVAGGMADMEAMPEGYSEEDARELFHKCDADGSGCISPEEFRTAMQELAPGMPPEKLEEGLKELDGDGDGEITWEEFSAWWMKQCRVQQTESTSTAPASAGTVPPRADATQVADEVEKIVSMGQMVKTAMTVNRMAAKLKNKAAEAKNKRSMRQIFVSYAEAFGEKMAEAQMIRDAFEQVDADKSGFIDGKRPPHRTADQQRPGRTLVDDTPLRCAQATNFG